MKTLGQLKHIVSKIEGVDIGIVLSRVIGAWTDFCKRLKNQGLCYDYPDNPQVGFLLYHIGEAVEWSKKDPVIPAKKGGMKQYEPSQ
jgi:hypothetical protein